MTKERAGINIYDLLSDLLQTARGWVAGAGNFAPIVEVRYRSRDAERFQVPYERKDELYAAVDSIVAGSECCGVAQLQTQRFSIADEIVRAVSVSFMGENIGCIGLVQPYRKRKLEYRFESPIEIGKLQGGLDSGDYIWHHIQESLDDRGNIGRYEEDNGGC